MYWIAVGAIGYGYTYNSRVLVGISSGLGNRTGAEEINYENTVSHRITAKRIPTIDEIEEEIDRVFGSKTWGRRVAWCESRYNFGAINDTSGASGLFQFMPTTFSANGGDDIWNWKEQITIAKKMFDNGQAYQWSCK